LKIIEKIKTYSRITNLWGVARRYFVNNFYDGMLTVLGILLGFFVVLLKENLVIINSNLARTSVRGVNGSRDNIAQKSNWIIG